MQRTALQKILTFFIALVWVINGLFCKVLNLIPRHKEIVGHILGEDYAKQLTVAIGWLEILMAIWILSRIKSRLNAIIQIIIISTMNIIEFIVVPDLLLFGKGNAVLALVFIFIIYRNEIVLSKKRTA